MISPKNEFLTSRKDEAAQFDTVIGSQPLKTALVYALAEYSARAETKAHVDGARGFVSVFVNLAKENPSTHLPSKALTSDLGGHGENRPESET